MRTGYVSHPDCLKHEMMPGHPEQPARLYAIQDQLVRAGVFDFLVHLEAPCATREQLCRVHDPDYVDDLIARAPAEGLLQIDPDTCMNRGTIRAALRAAGAAAYAAELVIAGELDNAFCAVRPPGHHAGPRQAMGFCFFNNVAVGVGQALAVHGLERVAIVDFDVHHGNGTEDIFAGDTRVMVCSAFQHPLYPYSGERNVPQHLVNLPLKPGLSGAEFRAAIESRWVPELESFRPQMIFVSAGFDGHREDELADWQLCDADYAWVTTKILEAATRHAGGRVVSLLEGGYALGALGRSATAHIKTLVEWTTGKAARACA